MITKELVERINFLARKQKNGGLTSEEKEEQNKLRRIYIDAIKEQVRQALGPDRNIDEKGCDCGCGHDHHRGHGTRHNLPHGHDTDEECRCGKH